MLLPRPPLPGGPSPLKLEKPKCLQQCEHWSRVGTGTHRSAASHQCRLTDGSIQPRQVHSASTPGPKTHSGHIKAGEGELFLPVLAPTPTSPRRNELGILTETYQHVQKRRLMHLSVKCQIFQASQDAYNQLSY